MDKDVAYYACRMAEERKAAAEATSDSARECHLKLASGYESRLNELRAKNRRSTLRIVTAP